MFHGAASCYDIAHRGVILTNSPEIMPASGAMSAKNCIPLALFILRIGVFVVMLVWTMDKFIRPLVQHNLAN